MDDKQHVVPMLESLQVLPTDLNQGGASSRRHGLFQRRQRRGLREGRDRATDCHGARCHHPLWSERFSEPADLPADATPVQRMRHRIKTRKGRATYALRKQTVEPVFGIIKSVTGFRQFLTRGLDNVQNAWTLVRLAWSLKRMGGLCA